MKLPSGSKLGIPPRSPCAALHYAIRYLRADKKPVFVGKLATMTNRKLREWNKPHNLMQATIQRFLQAGHTNSIADYYFPDYFVIRGRCGVPRGHVKVEALCDA